MSWPGRCACSPCMPAAGTATHQTVLAHEPLALTLCLQNRLLARLTCGAACILKALQPAAQAIYVLAGLVVLHLEGVGAWVGAWVCVEEICDTEVLAQAASRTEGQASARCCSRLTLPCSAAMLSHSSSRAKCIAEDRHRPSTYCHFTHLQVARLHQALISFI